MLKNPVLSLGLNWKNGNEKSYTNEPVFGTWNIQGVITKTNEVLYEIQTQWVDSPNLIKTMKKRQGNESKTRVSILIQNVLGKYVTTQYKCTRYQY